MNTDVLNFLATRQDYSWFLGLLGWATAGAIWWQTARAKAEWRWLGWSALSGAGVCVGELIMLMTPVTPTGPKHAPHFWGDAWLGLCMAARMGGWSHTLCSSGGGRLLAWAFALTLTGLRVWKPDLANIAFAVALTVCAGLLGFRLSKDQSGSWAALVTSWTTGWLSSHGMLADWLDQRRRWVEVSHAGVFGATLEMLAGGAAAFALGRIAFRQWTSDRQTERRADLRVAIRRGAAWLLGGFALSALAGEAAQRGFERNMLTRIQAMAVALDTAALERCLGPEFRVEQIQTYRQRSGVSTVFGRSSFHAGPTGEPIRSALQKMREANPDARLLMVRTHHEGKVILCLGGSPAGLVNLERPVGPDDQADWLRQVRDFRGMVLTTYDEVAQARAPLLKPDGTMLGWIVMDVGVSSWVASQAQARASSFAVVALGLGVLALWCVQRWREREREAAVARANLALAADQLKTSFLAKVSHELRTPLQSILGYGELAHATTQEPAARRQIEALMQHGRLLTRLVNDLIDLNAIEAHGLRLLPEPARLPDVLLLPAESLQPRAAAKGLDFQIETCGPAGAWVSADPERVRQIVLNLTGNAVKFTERGAVGIRIAWELSLERRVKIEFSVRDTGPGIQPEQRDRLFKPFSRLSTAGKNEGAGLGLAIAEGLCRQMGGGIELESDGRNGSLFRATLVLESATAPAGPTSAAAIRLPGRKVLVADDNPLVRELFLEHLTQLGAACTAAADGAQAWERIQRDQFDVLVLDLSMPEIDGLALARRVRTQFGAKPRLVAASAHARPEHRAEAMDAGFDEFLVKPVPLDRLARAVVAGESADAAPLAQVRERLREQFRTEVRGQLAELDALLRAGRWEKVRALAHHLRNSAFAVDDPALGAALQPLEFAAETAQADGAQQAWPAVRDALALWTGPATHSSFTLGDSAKGVAANQEPK